MISDEVFRTALDKAFKAQGFIKSERNSRIAAALKMHIDGRDMLLDQEEQLGRLAQKKESIPSEKSEQIEFVRWFKKTYPDVVIMMIRNDGSRTFAERPEQLLMGLHPGASDLFIPQMLLWIEMKRLKGWSHSEEQKEFAHYVRLIGQHYILCWGAEDAKKQVLDFAEMYNC